MAYSLCGKSVANTGAQECDKSRGVLSRLLIFNGEIDAADFASESALFTRLVANAKLAKDAANKVFPLKETQEIADTSEQNTTGNLGLGFTTVLREGKPSYSIKMFAGSAELKRLRKFNNQTVRVLEVDTDGTIWGYKANNKFKGFQAKLFFTGNKVATGQAVEQGIVTVNVSILSTSEYIDNSYWAEVDGNLEDIVGLLDVTLAKVSNAVNVYQISAKIPGSNLIGDTSILPESGAALAGLAANFSARTGVGFATVLAITTITYNATLDTLAVTFDNTAHGALAPGAQIQLKGPTVAQLDAADITEVEIETAVIVKA
jgi:hypothetical protein